ncbi:hypothetical protein CPB83DRAFT_900017 [Crepidotus variabilis]|uniref:Uncharacterized protein n=1 Tax=Crepidotus variabilis TaxID=179855 RepID=A0A9P6E3S6_9AGAR|nr:hypothetical protein CPB83DRAFT_900017 [Crepidotus variabilis]
MAHVEEVICEHQPLTRRLMLGIVKGQDAGGSRLRRPAKIVRLHPYHLARNTEARLVPLARGLLAFAYFAPVDLIFYSSLTAEMPAYSSIVSACEATTKTSRLQLPVKPTKVHPLSASGKNKTITAELKDALLNIRPQQGFAGAVVVAPGDAGEMASAGSAGGVSRACARSAGTSRGGGSRARPVSADGAGEAVGGLCGEGVNVDDGGGGAGGGGIAGGYAEVAVMVTVDVLVVDDDDEEEQEQD